MKLPGEGLEMVAQTGARHLQKKVWRRLGALASHNEEDFHDARKALKAFIGVAGFLPERAEPLDPKLAEIADLLGDVDVSATLSDWLTGHGFSEKFALEFGSLSKRAAAH